MSMTHSAISDDSGEVWTQPGAWPVSQGVWRVPLPLPMDGLRAVNVYVIETPTGLTLIDGGWAIQASQDHLAAGLHSLGRSAEDINAFLVTHVHRDHYTQAVALRRQVGGLISLGAGEQPTLDRLRAGEGAGRDPRLDLLAEADAAELAEHWEGLRGAHRTDIGLWEYPDRWLEDGQSLTVGARSLEAIHTPGHTRGHFVFHDAAAALLFAGDHVLPTITPSIGFEAAATAQPLGDFLGALAKVRAMPDARLLPAHGPVVPSVHARVDALLSHHAERLEQCLECLAGAGATGASVAEQLTWTGRQRPFAELDVPNRVLATLETRAHLELLVAQGRINRRDASGIAIYSVSGGADIRGARQVGRSPDR